MLYDINYSASFMKVSILSFYLYRIQSVLEEVTQKIESLESQVNYLSVSTTTPRTTNQEQLAQSGDEKSEEENNKSYLKSLNITKVI